MEGAKKTGILIFPQALTGVRVSEDCGTGTYCVVVDHQGEVFCGIGDMDVTTQITPEWVFVWYFTPVV